jgi:hypothetical protein
MVLHSIHWWFGRLFPNWVSVKQPWKWHLQRWGWRSCLWFTAGSYTNLSPDRWRVLKNITNASTAPWLQTTVDRNLLCKLWKKGQVQYSKGIYTFSRAWCPSVTGSQLHLLIFLLHVLPLSIFLLPSSHSTVTDGSHPKEDRTIKCQKEPLLGSYLCYAFSTEWKQGCK